MKKVCFYTITDDRYYYPIGTHILVNSFKYFHPDIDLIVFRQNTINKVFEKEGLTFYNCKPTFAKLLTDKYELVVNIDADTVILGRLDEILDQDYDVGAVWNFNDYEVASFENITSKMYVQAGLVGSRNKKFWDIWEEDNKGALKYVRQENDVLNLVFYNNPEVKKMKRVIWDKDKNYLGCKSLGREGEFILDKKKIMCRGEQVKAYHHAKGAGALPKLQFDNMGFAPEVVNFMKYVSLFGQTEVYGNL